MSEELRQAGWVPRAQVNDARVRGREVSQRRNARAILELIAPFSKGIRNECAPNVIHHSPTLYGAVHVTGLPRRLPGPSAASRKQNSARPLIQQTRTVNGIVGHRRGFVKPARVMCRLALVNGPSMLSAKCQWAASQEQPRAAWPPSR